MRLLVFISVSFALICCTSCSIQPEEINYGKDACHFCKMAIVEKKYGSEIVTEKGKVFKYDAIECMLRAMKEKDLSENSLFLVTDYHTPEKLIDATKATFLISEKIRSPMGANLSAFANNDSAKLMQKEQGGTLFNWTEIQKKFSK